MVDVSDITKFDKLEDRLTAQLIVTLEHSPRDKVLKPFLEKIGFKEEIEDVRFDLQVREVSSIPDAKIEGSSSLIYIESKLSDSLDPTQIVNHFEGGKGKKPRFCILCITTELSRPKAIREAQETLQERGEAPDIRWISWKEVYKLMKNLGSTVNDDKAVFLINSLNSTLEKRNLIGFTNFSKEEFVITKRLIRKYSNLLKRCNLLAEEVVKELEKNSIKLVYFNRDGRSTDRLDQTTYAMYYFNKKDWAPLPYTYGQWEPGSVAYFGFRFKEALVGHGVWVNGDVIYKQDALWKSLVKQVMQEKEVWWLKYRTRGGWTDVESAEQFIRKLKETRNEKTITNVEICFPLSSIDKLQNEDIKELNTKLFTGLIKVDLDLLKSYSLFKLVEAESKTTKGQETES